MKCPVCNERNCREKYCEIFLQVANYYGYYEKGKLKLAEKGKKILQEKLSTVIF